MSHRWSPPLSTNGPFQRVREWGIWKAQDVEPKDQGFPSSPETSSSRASVSSSVTQGQQSQPPRDCHENEQRQEVFLLPVTVLGAYRGVKSGGAIFTRWKRGKAEQEKCGLLCLLDHFTSQTRHADTACWHSSQVSGPGIPLCGFQSQHSHYCLLCEL